MDKRYGELWWKVSDQPIKAPWADLRDLATVARPDGVLTNVPGARIRAWWSDVEHIMRERDALRIEVDHLRAEMDAQRARANRYLDVVYGKTPKETP
jgi:hypothetical protein